MRKTNLSRFGTSAAIASIALFCSVVSPLSVAMGISTPSTWSVATEPSPAGGWNAVVFGGGRWVALGDSATVAVSSDASTWTEYPALAGSWGSVTYGDGRFLALSSSSASIEEMTSTNGQAWTASPGPVGSWTALTFGDGRFVAVSSAGQIDTSTNGSQWTEAWYHSNYSFTSVAYGDGHFVATDSAMGAVAISTNGVVWSRLFPAPNVVTKWSAVVYGEGEFVAFAGSNDDVATSLTGNTWSLRRVDSTQEVDGAVFGCGSFVGVGTSTGSTNSFISSSSGTTWTAAAVPIDATSNWTAVSYGAHKFVAVDAVGDIAWSTTTANCAAIIPKSPQQVSGNIESGRVWTYMHPPAGASGSPVNSYRVNISDGSVTKQCSAPVYFEPNCIINGLVNHHVYWVTAQSHNRFGYSVPTDPEFVIPVASANFAASPSTPVVAQGSPLVVQVTGIRANAEGIYPTSTVTVHVGAAVDYCHPNPFGECLISIATPTVGSNAIYATYTGYGSSYRSAVEHVTVQ